MKTTEKTTLSLNQIILASLLVPGIVLYNSCSSSSAGDNAGAPPPPDLPVLSVGRRPVTIHNEYTATLQGSRDIEIRPQVDGYLEAIYIDEGALVKKGQALFKIDSRPYSEQLNTALAGLASAKAALENASINVSKLAPLVQNNVVSDVQLRSAKAAYNAAKATVAQAQAQVEAAKINLGYTTIKAPASGYIGSIPFKTGSLVGKSVPEALTVLSETKNVHAYFTMSEVDFIRFKDRFPGKTIPEKIKNMPAVELVLADGSLYPVKGKVELADGQFGKTTGTINFRATFANVNGLLRSGNTGMIKVPSTMDNSILVPQEATFELQDKVFVYALSDSNKVIGKPLTIAGTSGNFYIVSGGLKAGEKIVFQGVDRLRDGMIINPKKISTDSLFKSASL